VTEWETAQLAMVAEQNATLIRLERAIVEQGETMSAVLNELQALGTRPNVVQFTQRLRRAEGEISELQGVTARLEAQIQIAAGGSDGG
jgi:TolA-binding protein